MTYEKFKKIVNGSKEFTFDGSILEISDYYSGETVRIDLDLIDEDTFDEIDCSED